MITSTFNSIYFGTQPISHIHITSKSQ